ncbi:high mobility group protein B3-like isoform X3 [Mastacembelus armatus]|uniref:high mobility group protein B3-like isoform X3 n=1 Tax=Mastacembelus armatus TaxID=205130 RepID=UPI000E455C1A|nr:high mobility group protein B3-like isoform X3 [Mastacembelus armatus]
MMRKDVNKPKGKTSAYAFFVQTCREEHRKKNPEQSVNFAEFSKKCSERWKRHRGPRRGPGPGPALTPSPSSSSSASVARTESVRKTLRN